MMSFFPFSALGISLRTSPAAFIRCFVNEMNAIFGVMHYRRSLKIKYIIAHDVPK